MKKTDIAILRFIEDFYEKKTASQFIDIKNKVKIEAICTKQNTNKILTLVKMRDLLRPKEISNLKTHYETIEGKQLIINFKN